MLEKHPMSSACQNGHLQEVEIRPMDVLLWPVEAIHPVPSPSLLSVR